MIGLASLAVEPLAGIPDASWKGEGVKQEQFGEFPSLLYFFQYGRAVRVGSLVASQPDDVRPVAHRSGKVGKGVDQGGKRHVRRSFALEVRDGPLHRLAKHQGGTGEIPASQRVERLSVVSSDGFGHVLGSSELDCLRVDRPDPEPRLPDVGIACFQVAEISHRRRARIELGNDAFAASPAAEQSCPDLRDRDHPGVVDRDVWMRAAERESDLFRSAMGAIND